MEACRTGHGYIHECAAENSHEPSTTEVMACAVILTCSNATMRLVVPRTRALLMAVLSVTNVSFVAVAAEQPTVPTGAANIEIESQIASFTQVTSVSRYLTNGLYYV